MHQAKLTWIKLEEGALQNQWESAMKTTRYHWLIIFYDIYDLIDNFTNMQIMTTSIKSCKIYIYFPKIQKKIC